MTISKAGTTISTDAQLREHWTQLMGDWGFGQRTLWLLFLEQDRGLMPTIVPIDGLPQEPDDNSLQHVTDLVSTMRHELGAASTPMLISRPGPDIISASDRRWARILLDAAHDQVPRWPVHLATNATVQVFAPDDLPAG